MRKANLLGLQIVIGLEVVLWNVNVPFLSIKTLFQICIFYFKGPL